MAFLTPIPISLTTHHPRPQVASLKNSPRPHPHTSPRSHSRQLLPRCTASDSPSPDDQQKAMDDMRRRLEGLFGTPDGLSSLDLGDQFDGAALRRAIKDRWSVQYDIQPQKRDGRVYVQIMWRYFEQQSFYMEEDEFASHCEAVAQLLQRWDAVDYFCDYIASVKKRPVVGLTINIPIPNIDANTEFFE